MMLTTVGIELWRRVQGRLQMLLYSRLPQSLDIPHHRG